MADHINDGGPAFTTLVTLRASARAGILSLPAPITWTQLNKFAEEVWAEAVASRAYGMPGADLAARSQQKEPTK